MTVRAVSDVVELADLAMYLSKRGGRDAWVGLHATERTQPEALLRRCTEDAQRVLQGGELTLTSSAHWNSAFGLSVNLDNIVS